MIPEGGGHWGLEKAQGASVRGEDDRHARGCFLRPMWARRTDRQPVQYLPKRIFWKRAGSGGGLCVGGQRESAGPLGASDTPVNLPTRKMASGSESIKPAHHGTSEVRTFPILPLALFLPYCSKPGWVEMAAWTMGYRAGERRS